MKKFILIAVCLLLVALITLGVCMYAIGENKDISKSYDMGSEITVTPPEDTPEAQKEMEKKFSVYNHVSETISGKKVLTLFSEEQAEEQWAKRQNGEQFRLTYDEILFLIGDSLRLYETYDAIVLTNAQEYDLLNPAMGETIHPELAEIVTSFRGEADEHYQRMADVGQIAVYRLALLDSRLRKAEFEGLRSDGERYVDRVTVEGVSSEQFAFVEPDGGMSSGEILYNPSYLHGSYWVLMPEDGKIANEEAYLESLVKHLLCAEIGGNVLQNFTAEYPVLKLETYPCVVDPQTFETAYMLEAHQPLWELKASYLSPYLSPSSSTAYYPELTLRKGAHTARKLFLTFEVFGALDPRDAIVVAAKTGEQVGTLEAGEEFIELDLNNGTSILLPTTDAYDGETLAAAAMVESAYDYESNALRLCIPKSLADALRDLALHGTADSPYSDLVIYTAIG